MTIRRGKGIGQGFRGHPIRHGLSRYAIEHQGAFGLIDSIKYDPKSYININESVMVPSTNNRATSLVDFQMVAESNPSGKDRVDNMKRFIQLMQNTRGNFEITQIKTEEDTLSQPPKDATDASDSRRLYRDALIAIGDLPSDKKAMFLGDMILLGGVNVAMDLAKLIRSREIDDDKLPDDWTNDPKFSRVTDDEMQVLSDYLIYSIVTLAGEMPDNLKKEELTKLSGYYDNARIFLSIAGGRDNYDTLQSEIRRIFENSTDAKLKRHVFYNAETAEYDLKYLLEKKMADSDLDLLSKDMYLLLDTVKKYPDQAISAIAYAWHMAYFNKDSPAWDAMVTDDADIGYYMRQLQTVTKTPDSDEFKRKFADEFLGTLGAIQKDVMDFGKYDTAIYKGVSYVDYVPNILAHFIYTLSVNFYADQPIGERKITVKHGGVSKSMMVPTYDENQYLLSGDYLKKHFPDTWDKYWKTIEALKVEQEKVYTHMAMRKLFGVSA